VCTHTHTRVEPAAVGGLDGPCSYRIAAEADVFPRLKRDDKKPFFSYLV
jgi:hypothetical protein